ncbi:MAG TPA: MBL fold metallo-hydrolase [Smithellaceae bacterium]|nr:MBL fold metallo-hydrolase [Smithellaceae bacterium]
MSQQIQYDRPVPVAEGIYWVGFYEEATNFHCNPYIVVAGDQAVVIDSGSRPDFAVVMMKILQAGINPKQISALIYQHPDPDLCGSVPNMVDICENDNLIILSEADNNVFINYYLEKEKHRMLRSIHDLNYFYEFNGRTLQFIKTPYAHSPGSFVTYDQRTKTLFSSDIFGSYSRFWDLFLKFDDACFECPGYEKCPQGKDYCALMDILLFHQRIMPSGKALKYAMNVIKKFDIDVIAPQHGSVLNNRKDIYALIEKLASLERVGIDIYP